MKKTVLRLALLLTCLSLPASGAVVFVDLSLVPAYQNQTTPASTPGNLSLTAVSIPGISAGSGSYSLDLTISDFLGLSGMIEKYVSLHSTLNSVNVVFTAGPPAQATALGLGSVVSAGSNWYTAANDSLFLARHIVILGSTTDQGQWTDGQQYYAGFRFVDGSSYHYGYLALTVSSFDSTNALSIAGYAYETTPNQGVTIAAIPEPATVAAGLGAAALLFAAWRRRLMGSVR
jgi:hypothetical protein